MSIKSPTKDSYINTRMESKTKKSAEAVFQKLGLSQSEAIRLFYRQVVVHKGMPFPIRVPNKASIAALKEDVSKMKRYPTAKAALDDILGKNWR